MILANVLRNDRLVYLQNVISSVCSYKQNLRAYQPKIIVVEQNSLSKGTKYIDWMLLNIHACGWYTTRLWVHLQTHLPTVHPLVLPHIIMPDELSGTGANDITDQFWQNASIVFLSLTQPRAFGDDKVGSTEIITLYTILWMWWCKA